MDGLGNGVADARCGSHDVGSRTQVGNLAQVLHAVRLGLDRVGVRIVNPADYLDVARLHFERLSLCRRGNDQAGGFD